MYKRGWAFLLAAVLAFSPVMQASAAEVNVSETGAQEMPVETPEIVEVPEETPTPEVDNPKSVQKVKGRKKAPR